MTDPLHDALIAAVDRHRMWPDGAMVVVAVSGGQDSLALLHALNHLRQRWRLNLQAAHFNHNLRGEESDDDARLVASLSERWSIPCTVGCGDVAAAARRTHRSIHEAARDLRHRFLADVARDAASSRIALGHTLDDRIETVLLNILRGTGIDGLEGMAHVNGERVRPLLDVSRADTGAYCKQFDLPFRSDPSNISVAYSRTRVREELLPSLASYYNPGVRDALRRLSDLASEDAAFLREETAERFARAAVNIGAGRVVLSLPMLACESRAMQRRMVRAAIENVRGSLMDVDFATTESVLTWISETAIQRRFQLTLPPGDTRIVGNGDRLIIERMPPRLSALPVCRQLAIPGVTRVDSWGLEIVAEYVLEADPITASGAVIVPQGSIQGNLVVRNRRAGDRIQPLGMAGTRKVQDILVDRKVPREERDRVPIVEDEASILWVAGHVLSERARMGELAMPAVRLRMMPILASNGDDNT